MEIIEQLEPTPRGPYCGSIGFIGFDGSMDTAIVIRTMFSDRKCLSWQAGGAVVLDSDPESEYQETLTKARTFIHMLTEDG
jgi:para-aminobenzoate synthetase component 1